MNKKKKGLNTKEITLYNPNGDEEFDVYVSYTFIREDDNDLFDDDIFIDRGDIDIKHYESNNDDELPEWVTEDMVYDYLIEELEEESVWEDDEEDFDDDFSDDEEDSNW
jgi:hypothetical protein